MKGEVGRRARRLELRWRQELVLRVLSARRRGLHLFLWTLKVSGSGAKGSELCLTFRLMTVQFVKVNVTSPEHQSACGVGDGAKGREELGDKVLDTGFTEDAAGQQDSRTAGGALGNMVCWA